MVMGNEQDKGPSIKVKNPTAQERRRGKNGNLQKGEVETSNRAEKKGMKADVLQHLSFWKFFGVQRGARQGCGWPSANQCRHPVPLPLPSLWAPQLKAANSGDFFCR